MPSKRKREDNEEVRSVEALEELLSAAIPDHASTELALLYIMREHNVSPSLLQDVLTSPFIFLDLSEAI